MSHSKDTEKKSCQNCIHEKACAMVSGISLLPVEKFILSLKLENFCNSINEALAENCFHFENFNTTKEIFCP